MTNYWCSLCIYPLSGATVGQFYLLCGATIAQNAMSQVAVRCRLNIPFCSLLCAFAFAEKTLHMSHTAKIPYFVILLTWVVMSTMLTIVQYALHIGNVYFQ